MIKLSDYVIDFLVTKGISDIFLVSGGGIMHLLDSVGRNKKIRYIANHHEQASAIGAEAYARVKNHIGACLVTVGPGATNAITGVAGAWTDSVPMIVLSGQVRRSIIANYVKVRQLGPQEVNTAELVKPITKYVKTILDPSTIRYELEKAFYLATSGRPGPVWLDFPLDVQGEMIDEKNLPGFSPPTDGNTMKKDELKSKVKKVIEMLQKAKRPVLIAGFGIRLSQGEKLLDTLIKHLNIPILLPYNGLDLIAEDHPLLMGKFGPVGQRRGNFTLQNSDLVLSIGASLSLASIGFDYKGFAPKAKKVMVNIDPGELTKPTLSPDLAICSDCKDFMGELLVQTKKMKPFSFPKWISICKMWKKRYPQIIPDFFTDTKHVNSYIFFDKLSDLLTKDDIVLTGNSLDAVGLYQAFKVKKGQRAFTNANLGGMGWDLPAAIGASVAGNWQRTILVTGDGSIQFNIQELETVKYYKLPIKIFIFNNDGYESIRFTQNSFFSGHFVGSDRKSGVSNPNFHRLAQAHDLHYEKIQTNKDIIRKIKKVLTYPGPVVCEVFLSPTQGRVPKSASFRREDGTLESRPLEDMYPFLSREELRENMHLFDKEETK